MEKNDAFTIYDITCSELILWISRPAVNIYSKWHVFIIEYW